MHPVTVPVLLDSDSVSRAAGAIAVLSGHTSLTSQWHHGWIVEAFLQTTGLELDAGAGLSIDVRVFVLHLLRRSGGDDWQ